MRSHTRKPIGLVTFKTASDIEAEKASVAAALRRIDETLPMPHNRGTTPEDRERIDERLRQIDSELT